MKILMLTQNAAWRGGTFARCFNLGRGLVSLGHEVTVMAAGAERRWQRKICHRAGVAVVEMPGMFGERVRHAGIDPLDVASRIGYALGGHDFDVVHTFDHRPSVIVPALLVGRWRGVTLISDWCDLWGPGGLADMRSGIERRILGLLDSFLEAQLHQRADGMTVVSSMLYGRAAKPEGRLHLLPPGADVEHIGMHDRDDMGRDMRRKFGLSAGGRVIVYSGYTSNSIPLLADSFAAIAREVADVSLLVVGGTFAELTHRLEAAALRQQLVYSGVVAHEALDEVLACGDIMILPLIEHAVNEAGFPNKLGDYLAAGRPVVANAVGDAGAFIEREQVGLVSGPDAESLAEAAVRLLTDQAAYAQMARNARRVAEENSWLVRAQNLDVFYRAVMDAR